MLSLGFSRSFGDVKGTNRGIFHLTRGFAALSGTGEGFGRGLTHEDIKKEKRAVVAAQSPKSIDEIVLPFFTSKGKGLENVAERIIGYVSFVTSGKVLSVQRENAYRALEHAPFMPSFAVDVRAALLPYVRSGGDYSLGKIEAYETAAYEPAAVIVAPSRYAVDAAPLILVPPKAVEKVNYRAEAKTQPYGISQLSQPYIVAPLMTAKPSVLYVPSSFIEKTVAYQRVSPIIPVHVALNLPQHNATMPQQPYQAPVLANSRAIPAINVKMGEMPVVQNYHLPAKKADKISYLSSVVSKYVRPIMTALGLSIAPALTFSGEHIAVQKESVPIVQRHSDISSLVEPQRIARAEQPRVIEKIKRELPQYERAAAPAQLEHVAKEMEAKYGGEMSFMLINMKEGYSWGRKDEMIIPPASLSKLGLVYATRVLAERGDVSLDQKISMKAFMEQHPEALPRNIGKIKEEYSMREVLEVVVRDWRGNSNLFSNMLLDMLGLDTVHSVLKEDGFKKTTYRDIPWREKGEYHLNTTSLQEIGRFMMELLDQKRWSSQYTGVFEKILQAHEAWAPLLLGSLSEQKGVMPTIYLKQGGTENAMSLVSYIVEPNGNAYLVMGSMTGTKERIVKEDMRKATSTGVNLVNDFIYFARNMYAQKQSAVTFNYR